MPRKYPKGWKYGIVLACLLASLVSSKNINYYKKSRPQESEARLPKKAFVTRVVDGDTIVVDNDYHVRYIGINTPETRHPKRPVEYFGKEASWFNKNLVMGKEVTLEYDVQKFDRYGRLLAYVHAGDIFVNAKLVEEGYAHVFTMPPNVKYANLFLGLQRKARTARKGLWQNLLTK